MGVKKKKKTRFGDLIESDFHRAKAVHFAIDSDPNQTKLQFDYASYASKKDYQDGLPMMEFNRYNIGAEEFTPKIEKALKRLMKALDQYVVTLEDFSGAEEEDEDPE